MKIVKNLVYPDWDLVKQYEIERFNSREIQQIMFYQLQKTKGIRLFVTKKVSDELNNTDVKDISYENIFFPAISTELFFEDPKISTCLFQKAEELPKAKSPFKNEILNKIVRLALDGSFEDYNDYQGITLVFGHTLKEKMVYVISYDKENFNKWMIGDIKFNEGFGHLYSDEPPDEINHDYGKYLLNLCIKVFLYISIPEYKAIPITDRTLQRQGKAGVKGRPNRPLSKVIYVPSTIDINKQYKFNNNNGDKKISPHMRRGHFMMLKHNRYKEQNKLIFRRPCMIHGGSLQNKLYVAKEFK